MSHVISIAYSGFLYNGDMYIMAFSTSECAVTLKNIVGFKMFSLTSTCISIQVLQQTAITPA